MINLETLSSQQLLKVPWFCSRIAKCSSRASLLASPKPAPARISGQRLLSIEDKFSHIAKDLRGGPWLRFITPLRLSKPHTILTSFIDGLSYLTSKKIPDILPPFRMKRGKSVLRIASLAHYAHWSCHLPPFPVRCLLLHPQPASNPLLLAVRPQLSPVTRALIWANLHS